MVSAFYIEFPKEKSHFTSLQLMKESNFFNVFTKTYILNKSLYNDRSEVSPITNDIEFSDI